MNKNDKAYRIELGSTVSGWNWKVIYSEPSVVSEDIRFIAPKDGRVGISSEKTVVWFDGIRPGKTFADIVAVGFDGITAESRARFWLTVDDDLKVTRTENEPPDTFEEALDKKMSAGESE